jgi:hypothetical protein
MRANAVPDRVLDQRLEDETRHRQIQNVRADVDRNRQTVPEASLRDVGPWPPSPPTPGRCGGPGA